MMPPFLIVVHPLNEYGISSQPNHKVITFNITNIHLSLHLVKIFMYELYKNYYLHKPEELSSALIQALQFSFL